MNIKKKQHIIVIYQTKNSKSGQTITEVSADSPAVTDMPSATDRSPECSRLLVLIQVEFFTKKYQGYSESNPRLFYATNVGEGESSRMRGSVT
jgi:hypothetical protein